MIRSFQYRNPRVTTGFPVEFLDEDGSHAGECTDISLDGLRAHMEGELTPGMQGKLILAGMGTLLHLEAIVMHREHKRVGFLFLPLTPETLETLHGFLGVVAGLRRID